MSDDLRVPATSLGSIKAQMGISSAAEYARIQSMNPDNDYGLGMAKVINIDYVEMYVTLRTLSGVAQQYDRVPVPLTFPGAGNRHFFGAIPCIGDYCVVGWTSQRVSSAGGGTKTPVILAWLVPGVWTGSGWMTTADFERDEFDQSIPKNQQLAEGAHNFVRHKLRHMQPGNIVASSAQGSDLVLDEGVILANRRGNEFRLRDQDQAAVTRALQRFDALAGTRVYSGMVQRDAHLLATSMISDGLLWDDTPQAIAGEPVEELFVDFANPKGYLKPARMFRKKLLDDTSEGFLGRSLIGSDPYLDPYSFLRNGLFIDETGAVVDSAISDAVYGGKPIYRVASNSRDNATTQPDTQTFTEYRLEINHTSDGRLPVTEQTDMFDADRLPQSDPEVGSLQQPSNTPFIEWVLGSVVGNDVYTPEGRRAYGLPLQATIFDGNMPNARIEPAIVDPDSSFATPISEHLATLFKLRPVNYMGGRDTFWGVNKKGQFKASLGGPPLENSAEISLAGGLKLAMGGRFDMIMDGHIGLVSRSEGSLDLRAEVGPVTIYGGGTVRGANISGTGGGQGDLPAVDIQGKTNVWVGAKKQLKLQGREILANASYINLTGQDGVAINGVNQVSVGTENFQVSVSGKCSESFAGPKSMLPTSGPLHERTYTPNVPGLVCEKVVYTWGDREEQFKLGNHTTEMLVGNMLYSTKAGSWKAQSVSNSLELSPSGMKADIAVGNVSINAVAGSATISGLTGVTIQAAGGAVIVKGGTNVNLSAPVVGSEMGPIITGGSRDPLTNLPFSTFGMGSPNHLVTP